MKFIPAEDGQVLHRLELTRRNLLTLLAKLDDPLSKREIIDGDWHIVVHATEDEIETDSGIFFPGAGQCVEVVPVEDEAHYANRAPGPMVLPSTGEKF